MNDNHTLNFSASAWSKERYSGFKLMKNGFCCSEKKFTAKKNCLRKVAQSSIRTIVVSQSTQVFLTIISYGSENKLREKPKRDFFT